MCQDNETLITLAIANSSLELHVISFTGHEALNEPYRFDIDLISPTPNLDFRTLMACSAYLSFGDSDTGMDEGIHGLIGSAGQLHAGIGLSHYRVSLVPRIQALQQRSHRRIFKALSVPQIIMQLLDEHGITDDSYRFEQASGLYPPRPICAQYDESDLHLLQRLCEEEGIHYRFEHSRSSHLLIFADDPGSFPEQPTPTRFQGHDAPATQGPAISHMAERFSIQTSYSSHGTFALKPQSGQAYDNMIPMPASNPAANQPCDALPRFDQQSPDEARIKQSNERTLERLRCERRQVHGYSDQPSLVSGQILQVLAHPDSLFNDQWLLTEIHHAGKQPQLLEGFEPFDIAAIFDYDPLPSSTGSADEIAPFSRGYRNHFRVIPWAMPFRPSLRHSKPQIQNLQTATLTGVEGQPVERDEQDRVLVSLDWQQARHQPSLRESNQPGCWLPLTSQRRPGEGTFPELTAGTRVLVSYFDNDPDQPVVCGYLAQAADAQAQRPVIRIDGLPLEPVVDHIHLSAGQTLQADATQVLTLNTPQSRIELRSDSIQVMGPQSLPGDTHKGTQPKPILEMALCAEDQPTYGRTPQSNTDLRLTEEPGLLGQPLAYRIWYIVRMEQPSLKYLARLEPQHFLFEGRTDDEGYLGLDRDQLLRLAMEYRKSPQSLCLVHPGHCLPLSVYFQQNWTPQQLEAFSQARTPMGTAP